MNTAGREVYAGAKDAFAVPLALIIMYGSGKIRAITAKCVLLNGIIFLGSIYFFERLLFPYLTTWIEYWIFRVFWVIPMYLVSFVLNSLWYQRLANQVHEIRQKKKTAKPTYETFVYGLSDEIYRNLMFVNYLAILLAVYELSPAIIGMPIVFLGTCWIYAFYSFEYHWMQHGWSLERRVRFLEDRWAYFLGFGLPCTCFTYFWPGFVSGGVFAVIFPVYVVMASCAKPPDSHLGRFPVFTPARYVNEAVLKIIARRSRVH